MGYSFRMPSFSLRRIRLLIYALLAALFVEPDSSGQTTNAVPPPPTISTNQVFARRKAKLVLPGGKYVPVGVPFRVVAEVEPDAVMVRFFANGVPIGTATKAPFEVNWSTEKPGEYNLSVVISYGPSGPHLAVAAKETPSAAPFSLKIEDAGTGLYVVEASSDLKQWGAISTNGVTDALIQFADPDAPRHRQRFYRVRQLL